MEADEDYPDLLKQILASVVTGEQATTYTEEERKKERNKQRLRPSDLSLNEGGSGTMDMARQQERILEYNLYTLVRIELSQIYSMDSPNQS